MDQINDKKFRAWQYIIDHIILPPKLPRAREEDVAALEVYLLEFVLQTLREFVSQVTSEDAAAWNFLVRMLDTLVRVETAGAKQSIEILKSVESMDIGDTIPLFIKAQNAGLLIHRQSMGTALIEVFEASPLPGDVTRTMGRLDRDFPGLRVAVPWKKLSEGDFLSEFCRRVAQLYSQEPSKATKEALGVATATWDTPDPFLITEYLIDILTVKGKRQPPLQFRKHTRDHALCADAERPENIWRRSSLWLVLRIALQRSLQWAFPGEPLPSKYKAFMLYLIAAVGSSSLEVGFSSDVVDIIKKKLARRQYKIIATNVLGLAEFVRIRVNSVVERLSAHLERVSQNEQGSCTRNIPPLNDIPILKGDTLLPLTRSLPFLQDRVTYVSQSLESKPFQPDRGGAKPTPSQYPDVILDGDEKSRLLNIADNEDWMSNHLSKWANKNRYPLEYQQVLDHMKKYLRVALEQYQGCPRELSAIILDLAEMWIVIDRMCVDKMVELRSFHPEIRIDFFEPLLLPSSQQLKRLQAIEAYLKTRHHEASNGHIGPLSDPEQNMLAVLYFDVHQNLKDLQRDIEKDAKNSKNEKEQEWIKKRAQQESLRSEANTLSHDYIPGNEAIHDPECQKCKKKNEADDMKITQIRNPLPNDQNHVKAILFECKCPTPFLIWRDATWLMLQTLGRGDKVEPSSSKGESKVYLHDQPALKSYCKSPLSRWRVRLAAARREPSNSILLPDDFHRVCAESQLEFRFFDHDNRRWLSDQDQCPSVKSLCNFQLSEDPFGPLQWALEGTTHSSNQVCAKKDHHDLCMQPSEFLALGHLRSGDRLQLLNLLVELGNCNLSFEQEHVSNFVFQAIWEAGRPSQINSVFREAHQQLSDPSLCLAMLKMIKHVMDSIGTNWKRQQTMLVIIIILQRILSMAQDFHEISTEAMGLLCEARQLTINWCHRLKDQIDSKINTGNESGNELFLYKAAALCCITFDIDETFINDIVTDTNDSVAVLTEACMLTSIYSPEVGSYSVSLHQLRLWYLRSIHRLQPILQTLIEKCPTSFNKIIEPYLPRGSKNLKWTIFGQAGIKGRKGRWAQSKSSSQQRATGQTVHYDFLFGELFVDGMQVGKVPEQYRASPLFQRVFGLGLVNVVKSNMPGMDYKLAKIIEGNEFHLGMHGGRLTIRAQTTEGSFEIIPPNVFQEDLPDHLLQNYMHWLHLHSRTVEFRPLIDPWKPNLRNWRLDFSDGTSATMRLGNNALLSYSSGQASAIREILARLADRNNIHLELIDGERVQAFLPEHDLCFFVNTNGRLQSEHLNAEIDSCQDAGTWYGLKNMLVLRNPQFRELPSARLIIVPVGEIVASRTREHVRVSIHAPPEEPRRRYLCFPIDPYMGTLRSTDNFSAFYQAYLHAVTSLTMPDPLTGYTGVEMALRILRKKHLLTTQPADAETSQMRALISSLSPCRRLLNKGVECVTWNEDLPQTTQQEEFLAAASNIYNHMHRHLAFDSQSPSREPTPPLEVPPIHQRATNFNATLQSYEFGGSALEQHYDCLYSSRDNEKYRNKDRAHCVFETAMLLENPPSKFKVIQDFPNAVQKWHSLAGFHRKFCISDIRELLALDWGGSWGSLYDLCRFRESSQAHLQFLFGAIAFGKFPTWNDDGNILRIFLAITTSDSFRRISPPPGISAYRIEQGFSPNLGQLQDQLVHNYSGHGLAAVPSSHRGKNITKWKEKQEKHREQRVKHLATLIYQQWPAEDFPVPDVESWEYLDKETAILSCKELWEDWRNNNQVLPFLEKIESALANLSTLTYDCPFVTDRMADGTEDFVEPMNEDSRPILPDFKRVLQLEDAAKVEYWPTSPMHLSAPNHVTRGRRNLKLEEVTDHLQSHTDDISKKYVANMLISCDQFKKQPVVQPRRNAVFAEAGLTEEMNHFSKEFWSHLESIVKSLKPDVSHFKTLELAGLMPRLTSAAMFEFLALNHAPSERIEQWNGRFHELAGTLKNLQRSERLMRLYIVSDQPKLIEESSNKGLDPEMYKKYPQWLILELEGDLMIRKEQGEVAAELIARCLTRHRPNTVLQYPMGQGKSSLLIPMIITVLANGTKLVRIVVLRPLRHQTLNQLQASLGGLLNRKIYHVPISRSSRFEESSVRDLDEFFKECMASCGVVVTIPDELLSLKLLTYDLQANPSAKVAQRLAQLGQWLEQNTSDVLDESDEILDPHFQLIYPRGAPVLLDDSSDRWALLQAVLSRVKYHAEFLKEAFPATVEVMRKGTRFPLVNIFGAESGGQLLKWLVDDMMEGRLGKLKVADGSRAAVEEFIYAPTADMVSGRIKTTMESFSNHTLITILLFRGLISHGVLLFALRKRWSVEYGLDLTRCHMAVPFVARNTPSESSEHAHTDLRILLTYLSYYYDGLTFYHIRETFKHPDSADQFPKWIKSPHLRRRFPVLESVNLDDDESRQLLIGELEYNEDVINFFLKNIVFPNEGKYFPRRLSASGWDIPASRDSWPTIGFSGTNENQDLLPMNIEQEDLPNLAFINAADMNKILEPQTWSYSILQDEFGRPLSSEGLLASITNRPAQGGAPIQVLIDVGAYVLDLQNREVASHWLGNVSNNDFDAAIFYDKNHIAQVVDRSGSVYALQLSPFRDRLDRCLVYLDEAHTRGIDLRFRSGTRAAVILGPRLVTDRLLQACMRMRRLAEGHDVVFYAPLAVHKHILEVNKKTRESEVTAVDLIQWSISNTLQKLKTAQASRVIQGLQFSKRYGLWTNYLRNDLAQTNRDRSCAERFLLDIQDTEDQSLQVMYGDQNQRKAELCKLLDHDTDDPMKGRLVQLFHQLQTREDGHTQLDEEQERETAHEVQREFHAEGPLMPEPCCHSISQWTKKFIATGRLRLGTSFLPAFSIFQPKFTANSDSGPMYTWSSPETGARLYVTADFSRCVNLKEDTYSDWYQRQPRWIITSRVEPSVAVIISPYEVQELWTDIQESSKTTLHAYTARTTASMVSFSCLDIYTMGAPIEANTIPSSLLCDINLFAGALCIDSYQDYLYLCHYLGVATPELPITMDGNPVAEICEFVPPERRALIGWPTECPFTSNVLPFLKYILSVRHSGSDISETHMGMLVDGKLIPRERFDDRESKQKVVPLLQADRAESNASASSGEASDERPRKRRKIDLPSSSDNLAGPSAGKPGAESQNTLFIPSGGRVEDAVAERMEGTEAMTGMAGHDNPGTGGE
ncbi:MAG: hypothetical protein M1820_004192 [Bogoriella megaspora]|nr:MAG: hypothetical protein M1820_004192 [Bogoriella megaspora]